MDKKDTMDRMKDQYAAAMDSIREVKESATEDHSLSRKKKTEEDTEK